MNAEVVIFAHTFGAGGPDIELLLLAGGLFVLGVTFFFQKSVKPQVPFILVLAAFALTAGAFALSGDDPADRVASQARLEIVQPSATDVVRADQDLALEISLTGGTLAAGSDSADLVAGHLHVYWDGRVVSMPSVADPVVDGDLVTEGTHELIVEFVDLDHRPFDPSVQARVTVTAE